MPWILFTMAPRSRKGEYDTWDMEREQRKEEYKNVRKSMAMGEEISRRDISVYKRFGVSGALSVVDKNRRRNSFMGTCTVFYFVFFSWITFTFDHRGGYRCLPLSPPPAVRALIFLSLVDRVHHSHWSSIFVGIVVLLYHALALSVDHFLCRKKKVSCA